MGSFIDSHLTQLNVARLLHPLDDPRIAEFVNGIAHINLVAERSKGFVWRLKTPSGKDADHPWSNDPYLLVNLSVWETPEDLETFVYRSGHLDYYLKRKQWFEKPKQPNHVLWWIRAGHTPTVYEAEERLEHHRHYGPTPYAFWFGKLFPAEPAALPQQHREAL